MDIPHWFGFSSRSLLIAAIMKIYVATRKKFMNAERINQAVAPLPSFLFSANRWIEVRMTAEESLREFFSHAILRWYSNTFEEDWFEAFFLVGSHFRFLSSSRRAWRLRQRNSHRELRVVIKVCPPSIAGAGEESYRCSQETRAGPGNRRSLRRVYYNRKRSWDVRYRSASSERSQRNTTLRRHKLFGRQHVCRRKTHSTLPMAGNIKNKLRRENVYHSSDVHCRPRGEKAHSWIQVPVGHDVPVRLEMCHRANAVFHVSQLRRRMKSFSFNCLCFAFVACQMARTHRWWRAEGSSLTRSFAIRVGLREKFYLRVFSRCANKARRTQVRRKEKPAAFLQPLRALKTWLIFVSFTLI